MFSNGGNRCDTMTKKRRNCGRSNHGHGISASVLCNGCNSRPKKDKCIKRFIVRNIVDPSSLRDVRDASCIEGYQVPKMYQKVFYCVSCAIHRRVVRVRSTEARRVREGPPRANNKK